MVYHYQNNQAFTKRANITIFVHKVNKYKVKSNKLTTEMKVKINIINKNWKLCDDRSMIIHSYLFVKTLPVICKQFPVTSPYVFLNRN